MSENYPFTRLVRGLPSTVPFVGPETLERQRGAPFRARLGANESAFGTSPLAQKAMAEAASDIAWYNDPENFDIRNGLARHLAIPAEHITMGAGIDDLLGLVVRLFVEQGDTVVTSLGAYPTLHYHLAGFGHQAQCVPYRDGRNDLQALSDLANQTSAQMVYLSNPDNPAGTWHTAAEIECFQSSLPSRGVLILDEAYIEFAPEDAAPAIVPLLPGTIRMRTFSKVYGMAGARIGYAFAEAEVISSFEKVRHHFGVNRLAQIGALTSLDDTDFVSGVIASVKEGRKEYAAIGSELELPTLPSATNFVTFDAGSAQRAVSILNALQDRDVFVRKPAVPPLDRCFRVTVGMKPERGIFLEALRRIVKSI
jgi:histidinol-phosphate aminotransferase